MPWLLTGRQHVVRCGGWQRGCKWVFVAVWSHECSLRCRVKQRGVYCGVYTGGLCLQRVVVVAVVQMWIPWIWGRATSLWRRLSMWGLWTLRTRRPVSPTLESEFCCAEGCGMLLGTGVGTQCHSVIRARRMKEFPRQQDYVVDCSRWTVDRSQPAVPGSRWCVRIEALICVHGCESVVANQPL